jgi:hypothetical protein
MTKAAGWLSEMPFLGFLGFNYGIVLLWVRSIKNKPFTGFSFSQSTLMWHWWKWLQVGKPQVDDHLKFLEQGQ